MKNRILFFAVVLILFSVVFVQADSLDGNELIFGSNAGYSGVKLFTPFGAEQRITGFVDLSFVNLSAESELEISLIKYDPFVTSPTTYQEVYTREFSLKSVLNNQGFLVNSGADKNYTLSKNLKNISMTSNLIDLVPLNLRTPLFDDLDQSDFVDRDFNENNYNPVSDGAVTIFAIRTRILDKRGKTYNKSATEPAIEAFDNFVIHPLPVVLISPLYGAPNNNIIFDSIETFSPIDADFDDFFWSFGDGETKSTRKMNASHTYGEEGNYTLILNVTDQYGLVGTGYFDVLISPSYGVAEEINQKRVALANFIASLGTDLFTRTVVQNAVGVPGITAKIDSIEQTFNNLVASGSFTQARINTLKRNLSSIAIPLKVYDTTIVDADLSSRIADINPSHVNLVSGESVVVINGMANAIALWQKNNVALSLEGNVKSALYMSGSDELLSIVIIRATPLSTISQYYVIVELPFGVTMIDTDGATVYDELSPEVFAFMPVNNQDIVFAINSGDILGMKVFASPPLSELSVSTIGTATCGNNVCDIGEDEQICPEDCKGSLSGLTLLIIILVMIIAGVIVFFIWYKKQDVNSGKLFKTKRDYTNITGFIKRNLGIKGSLEIKSILLRAGWSAEQIDYAMKKVLETRAKERQKMHKKFMKNRPIIVKPISKSRYLHRKPLGKPVKKLFRRPVRKI